MTKDRYQRHSLIDWFSQEKTQQSKFAVIGCGAVGNEVAKNLALLGVGNIDLFDFDSIEAHNLTKSVLFRESDIGHGKAEVAEKRVKELDPNINVRSFFGDFWDSLSIIEARSYDCIFCCVDNFEARIKLNQLCLIAQVNLINTGIDSKYGQVEIFPYASNDSIACYECNLPNSAYERIQQRYSCGWLKKISYIEKKIPTTIITSSLTGSLAVSNALKLINGEPLKNSKRILIDSFTGSSTLSDLEQSSTCPACSSLAKNISVIQANPVIGSEHGLILGVDDDFITSDPLLVSYKCVECDSKEEIIFEKASNHDSTITVCNKCGNDSVAVVIKDGFTFSEITEKFMGRKFPCKFIRYDTNNLSTIIEMEH